MSNYKCAGERTAVWLRAKRKIAWQKQPWSEKKNWTKLHMLKDFSQWTFCGLDAAKGSEWRYRSKGVSKCKNCLKSAKSVWEKVNA